MKIPLNKEELIKAVINMLNLIMINIFDISLAFLADSSISSVSGATKDLDEVLLKKIFKNIKIVKNTRVMMKNVKVIN